MKVSDKVIKILKTGGIGILPTDTIYGLVGSALLEPAVRRIYKVRKRDPKKPLIILIGDLSDLKEFGAVVNGKTKFILEKVWPGKVSIILPCKDKKFEYLHRGTNGLAFRLPAKKSLRNLIGKVGPLVAPSANPEGYPPARTPKEAEKYFGDQVDFYSGSGELESLPSTLIEIKNGKIRVLRQGEVKIKSKKDGRENAKN